MIGKKGKVIVIIFIIILSISGLAIGFLEEALPDIGLGAPYGWETDCKNSTFADTYFTAKINITNIPSVLPTNHQVIDFVKELSKINVKFNNNTIGEITFVNPINNRKIIDEAKDQIVSIKSGKNITIDIYFRFLNSQIPIVLFEYLKEKECGSLNIESILYFKIENPPIDWSVSFTIKKIPVDKSILGKLNEELDEWIKKPLEKEVNITSKLSLLITKDKNNRTRVTTPLLFKFKKKIPFLRFYTTIKNNLSWIDKNEINTVLGINISQLMRKVLFLIPHENFKIFANDLEIGDITLTENEKSTKRKIFQIFRRKTKDFHIEIKLENMMLDDWFASHIKNEETTNLKVYMVHKGKIYKNFPWVNKTKKISISDIFKKINWTKSNQVSNESYLPQFFMNTQIGIGILIIGLAIFILVDYRLEKRIWF